MTGNDRGTLPDMSDEIELELEEEDPEKDEKATLILRGRGLQELRHTLLAPDPPTEGGALRWK